MDQEISVYVNAKIADLNKQMAEGARSVANFAVSADGSLVTFGKSLDQLQIKLRGYQTALKSTINPQEAIRLNQLISGSQTRINAINSIGAGNYDKLAKAQYNAGYAAQNFGRVIQDLPFGLIAIQNNIVPLAESLGASAGLGLALSLATAATTLWFQATQNSGRAAKQAAKDNVAYEDTLDNVTSAELKGAEAAQKDQTNLKLLYGAYNNANLPLTARKEAYEELQHLYPSYFGNTKFEKAITQDLSGAYKTLSAEILASARARAASDLITQNATRQLEDRQKIVEIEKENLKVQTKLNALPTVKKGIGGAGGGTEAGDLLANRMAADRAKLEKDKTDNLNKQRNLATDILSLDAKNAKLTETVYQNIAKGGKLTDGTDKQAKEKLTKTLQFSDEWLALWRKKVSSGLDISTPLDKMSNDVVSTLTEQTLGRVSTNLKKFTDDQTQLWYDFEDNILTGLGAGFDDFFNNIITKGQLSFHALGNSILAEFSRIVSAAVTRKLLGLILKIAGGLVGGPAGSFAASALGGFLIPGFANGVTNFGGGLAMVGERGPELVNLPRGSSVIPNSGMGGAIFIANSYVRGNLIETTYNRSVERTNRIN